MDPIQKRSLSMSTNAVRNHQSAYKAGSSRNPFHRLIVWLGSTKLGKLWRQTFSRPVPPAKSRPLAKRQVKVQPRPVLKTIAPPLPKRSAVSLHSKSKAPGLATIAEEPEPHEAFVSSMGQDSAPPKPKRGVRRTSTLPNRMADTAAAAKTKSSNRSAQTQATSKIKTSSQANRESQPTAQHLLLSTLDQLARYQDDPSLSTEEKGFCISAYQTLSLLALDNDFDIKGVMATLQELTQDEDMPTKMHTAMTAQLKSISKLAGANKSAHAEFLSRIDAGLAAHIMANPPKGALQAADLYGKEFYNELTKKFDLRAHTTGTARNPDSIPEFKTYVEQLATKMQKDAPWLAEESPATQAFLDKPGHATLRAMLGKSGTGTDIIRQTWLHAQLVLSPDYRTQQYRQRMSDDGHLRPYALAQQLEFCERQFGIRYQSKMQPLTRSPQAQFASGVFVAQRLAQRRPGLSPEMFTLGHMLLLAKQGKLSLQESAHIYRAITSDSRPMVNFVYRNTNSLVPERVPTRTSQASVQHHKGQLAKPLPNYSDLAECFSDPAILTALGFTVYSSLRDATRASLEPATA